MRCMKAIVWILLLAMSVSIAGCYGGYVGYYDEPEWDGGVYVGGIYGRDYDRDHRWHGNAFRGDGRHSAGVVSDRGHASMGHSSGGGHAGGGGGGHR
jgi:hypothetical protein